MDVILETSKGRQFTLEIWFFDTVLAIKEKIEKYQGFPVSKQTLLFKGQVMADDGDTVLYDLLEGSRIQLVLLDPDVDTAAASAATAPELLVDNATAAEEPSSGAKAVRLSVSIALYKRHFSLECRTTDTIGRLRERIHLSEGIPLSRFSLFAGGVELQQESRTLADYEVAADGTEVSVQVIRPSGPNNNNSSSNNAASAMAAAKRLMVMVLPKCGTKKIAVEVNPLEQVVELRKELQRLHGQLHFDLPEDGYFFIYRQNVMEEDKTFRWHDVKHGDTIEIFNGSVTGGT